MIKHVYIHIPFCKYICAYCDFCKKYIKYQDPDKYLISLDKEIKSDYLLKEKISSLYIGGGTPSSLTIDQLSNFKEIIVNSFSFEDDYEFSFECNPDDINEEFLKSLKDMGVNRICIGIQTLNDQLLKKLKRNHSSEDCHNALTLTNKYFKNISVDFIFNLPDQTLNDIDDTIDFIKKYCFIKNISYYSLILEKNTILDTMNYKLLNEKVESKWYYKIVKKLNDLGYEQYEISNFSNGYHSIHNMAYWQQKQYYGFGLGASGYIGNLRYTNTSSIEEYYHLENKKAKKEILEKSDLIYEKIFLNLRTTYGIEKSFLEGLNIKYSMDDFNLNDGMLSIKKEKLFISSEIIVNILSQL